MDKEENFTSSCLKLLLAKRKRSLATMLEWSLLEILESTCNRKSFGLTYFGKETMGFPLGNYGKVFGR